jgi:hypothetical protein
MLFGWAALDIGMATERVGLGGAPAHPNSEPKTQITPNYLSGVNFHPTTHPLGTQDPAGQDRHITLKFAH